MNPAANTIGQIGSGNYSILVNPLTSNYRATGITLDWTDVTALTVPTTYPGGTNGVIAPAGEKVVPAGTVLFRKANGKYRPALTADTLVKGEVYIADRHFFQSVHNEQVGEVFDVGTVFQSRLLVGGAGVTLSALQTAMPRIGFYKD